MAGPELDRELRDLSLKYLQRTAEALGTTHGLEASYTILEGPPAKRMAEYAASHHATLIVMTTHGRGGFSRLWLGSVADQLLRRSSVPVLLLREQDLSVPVEYRHVLLAFDGGPEGDRIIEPAVKLASITPDCRFTLVHVVEPPVPLLTRLALQPEKLAPHWLEVEENRARSLLEQVARGMRERGLRVDTKLISVRGVAEQILGLSEATGADLIVVGTHGARGIERLVMGSVADKVIRGATRQVLVVPTPRVLTG